MIYSIWNPGTRRFDYYETPAQMRRSNVEKPSHLGPHNLGATPEQAAWPLPDHAVQVGSGPEARGRVAYAKGSLGDGSLGDVTPRRLLGLGVVGALGWILYNELR